MPPNEPCPHCGRLIGDWHNEWDEGAQRVAIYRGQPTMDGPPCRQAVLWFESRDLTAPPADAPVAVYPRSVLIAAHWVPVREPTSTNRADYLAHHPGGQMYGGYWRPGEVQQADQQETKP